MLSREERSMRRWKRTAVIAVLAAAGAVAIGTLAALLSSCAGVGVGARRRRRYESAPARWVTARFAAGFEVVKAARRRCGRVQQARVTT
jgi:hypothetical protein